MMYRIRDFAEGLGAGFTGALCLVVGILAGTLVTLQMSGGTPYSQVDLDRVADRTAVTKALPARSAAETRQAGRLSDLQDRNQRLAGELAFARTTIADLRDRLAVPSPSATLAPTEAPPVVPSAVPPAAPSATPSGGATGGSTSAPGAAPTTTTPTASGRRVTGTIGVSWILSADRKPWPASCSDVGQGYRVRVNAGDHSTVTLGLPDGARSVRRSAKGGILSLTCEVRYSATLPGPVSGVYEFVAVDADAPGKPLNAAIVKADDLAGGNAPRLSVTYCPECPSQG